MCVCAEIYLAGIPPAIVAVHILAVAAVAVAAVVVALYNVCEEGLRELVRLTAKLRRRHLGVVVVAITVAVVDVVVVVVAFQPAVLR